MKTAPKPAPAAKAKRPPGSRAKPSTPPGQPFIRLHHSEALRTKTLSLLEAIELAEDATVHRAALSSLVVELTSSSMDYGFMKPLKLARAGFLVEQTANLGLAGVQQAMGAVVHRVIGRMDGPQLLSICGSIRQLMR